MVHIDKNFEVKISKKNIDYEEAVKLMQNRVSDILRKQEKELIWFLNHDHIYTCGTSSNQSEILYKTNVSIINTNRGGKITYLDLDFLVFLILNTVKILTLIRLLKVLTKEIVDVLSLYKTMWIT